jgi:hypothetical protein
MISLLSVSRLSHSYVQGMAGQKFTHGQSNTSNLNFYNNYNFKATLEYFRI